MKRFYQHDHEDDEPMGDEEGEHLDPEEVMEIMQMDLVESQLNHDLLEKAIDIAKGDWLWMFRAPAKRLRTVQRIYWRLQGLMNSES